MQEPVLGAGRGPGCRGPGDGLRHPAALGPRVLCEEALCLSASWMALSLSFTYCFSPHCCAFILCLTFNFEVVESHAAVKKNNPERLCVLQPVSFNGTIFLSMVASCKTISIQAYQNQDVSVPIVARRKRI